MKPVLILSLCAITVLPMGFAGEKNDWWQYKPFKGSYLVYSGDLGEEQPPTSDDRKVSFSVTGALAQDMFDSMYPDSKERCSDDKGYRERSKGNITCTHDRNGYTCHFGFNLRTGASISGSTC